MAKDLCVECGERPAVYLWDGYCVQCDAILNARARIRQGRRLIAVDGPRLIALGEAMLKEYGLTK